MNELPVIRVKSTHPASQGDFVEINATDFNPDVYERYEEAAPDVPAPAPVLPPVEVVAPPAPAVDVPVTPPVT